MRDVNPLEGICLRNFDFKWDFPSMSFKRISYLWGLEQEAFLPVADAFVLQKRLLDYFNSAASDLYRQYLVAPTGTATGRSFTSGRGLVLLPSIVDDKPYSELTSAEHEEQRYRRDLLSKKPVFSLEATVDQKGDGLAHFSGLLFIEDSAENLLKFYDATAHGITTISSDAQKAVDRFKAFRTNPAAAIESYKAY